MNIVNLVQGSPEWHAHRAAHFNASDAPAMMGCSPYKTRTQLLGEYATGITQEVDASTQRRFDDGHRYEALARPIAEQIIGDDLYPVVGTEGQLSASFDGITLMNDVIFEHKSLNDDLRAVMVPGCSGADLPLHYRVQMEQQCMVSGAKRVLFMASKWAGSELAEERHCWYDSDTKLAQQIMIGWGQFADDLEGYEVPAAEQPKPIGKTPETLPALRIEVTGAVTASNLAAFKEHALEVFRGISTNLQTDQDFADAEKAVKWCGDVEDRLKAAKEHALSQTESIDALFRAIDQIANEARDKRLTLDKKIKARKDEIRGEIVAEAQAALEAHRAALNERLGAPWLARVIGPFGDAMKGKKTVASCRDAVSTALANAKIEMSAHADRLEINSKSLVQDAVDWFFLFADFAQVGNAPAETFKAVAEKRIRDHLEAGAARKAKEAADKAEKAIQQASTIVSPALKHAAAEVIAGVRADAAITDAKAAKTIKLGDINARLAPIQIDAAGLALLGFQPVGNEREAKLYRESDFPAMCRAMRTHLSLLFEEVPA